MRNVLYQFGELSTDTLKDGEPIWIEALTAKTHHNTPYGDVVVSNDKLENFVKNFKGNVRGIEVATDFEHGADVAKGNKASGWIRDAKVEGDRLMVAVEPTPVALSELKNKEWKYFSLDWEDSWKSNADGKTYNDVIMGGAFTNRPIAKGMMPINFAEVIGVEPDDITFAIVPPVENNDDDLGGESGMTDEEKAALDKATETIDGLRKLFNVPAEGDLVAAVTTEHKEFSELKAAATSLGSEKKFAEQFPEEAKRMQMLENSNRDKDAKIFSEALGSRRVTRKEGTGDDAKDINTNLGLSALALDSARSTHKKFSEGIATLEDFTGFVDTVMNGGILEYGERGSTVDDPNAGDTDVTPTNVTSIRKKFSEKVDVVVARDTSKELDYRACVAIAAKENPELYRAYSGQNPQVDEADAA